MMLLRKPYRDHLMLKSVELEYVMNALNKIENFGLFPAFIAYHQLLI